MVFSRRSGYLLVDDRLGSSVSRTFTQLWHLAPASRPTISGRTVRTHTPGGDVVISQLAVRPTISIVTGRTRPVQGWRTYRYDQKSRAPTVQARRTGRTVRFLTLIVPVRDVATSVRVVSVRLRANGYTVVVTVGDATERVVVDGSSVSITPLS